MVLQQAPNQANVWGYTSECEDKVTINFNQNDYPATMLKGIATYNHNSMIASLFL